MLQFSLSSVATAMIFETDGNTLFLLSQLRMVVASFLCSFISFLTFLGLMFVRFTECVLVYRTKASRMLRLVKQGTITIILIALKCMLWATSGFDDLRRV